jgi:dephospho-CoA kinase
MRSFVLGITGKAGSGKSSAAKILSEKYGFIHMDVDKFGHQALEEEKKRLILEFGDFILDADNSINREKLGQIVFSSQDKLLQLNAIVHPRINRNILSAVRELSNRRVVLDAALLYEIGLNGICDYIFYVNSPDLEIIERLKKYRGWSEERAKSVLQSQEYLSPLKEKADFVLLNGDGMDNLEKQIDDIIKKLLPFNSY